jgi:hypothetical protein
VISDRNIGQPDSLFHHGELTDFRQREIGARSRGQSEKDEDESARENAFHKAVLGRLS